MYLHRATTTTFPSKWHVAERHTLLLLAVISTLLSPLAVAMPSRTDGTYFKMSGTSMASAVVAGAGYLDVLAAATSFSTLGANIDLPISALSRTMQGDSETKKVSIDVTGKHELRLVMTDAGDAWEK